MQIVSINERHTQDVKDVAFNVQGALDEEVISLAQKHMSQVTLSIEGNVLRMKAALMPIDASLIESVNLTLADAVKEKQEKESKAAKSRDRMLNAVKVSTGLNFG